MNNTFTATLSPYDLNWILRRLPKKVVALMEEHPQKLFLAGGFIRAAIAQEPINDIDLFVPSKLFASQIGEELAEKKGTRVIETQNAVTIIGYHVPIQIVHRWVYEQPEQCLESFDFTIASAAIWKEPSKGWCSKAHRDFYADLAAKRLVYLAPLRNEDAGGSMLRTLKFYQRGYRMPLSSLGAVIARLVKGVRADPQNIDEAFLGELVTGLLHEVDPAVDLTHEAHISDLPKNDPEQEEVMTKTERISRIRDGIEPYAEERDRITAFLVGWKSERDFDKEFSGGSTKLRREGLPGHALLLGNLEGYDCLSWWIDLLQHMVAAGYVVQTTIEGVQHYQTNAGILP